MKEILHFSVYPMIKDIKLSPTVIAESLVETIQKSIDFQGLDMTVENKKGIIIITEGKV